MTLNHTIYNNFEAVVGLQQKYSSLRTVFGFSISGFQVLFGLTDLMEEAVKQIDFKTSATFFAVYLGVLGIGVPKLIQWIRNKRSKKNNDLEVGGAPTVPKSNPFKKLNDFQSAIQEKADLLHEKQLKLNNGLIIEYAAYVNSKVAEKVIENYIRVYKGLSEPIIIAKEAQEVTTLLRWKIENSGLNIKNTPELMFQEKKGDNFEPKSICIA